MRCFSPNLTFDSVPDLHTTDGMTALGTEFRKWQAAGDFVRGGALANRNLQDELKRFSRTCTRLRSSIGPKGLELQPEEAHAIAHDNQLVEIIRSNQHDYSLLDPYMEGNLRAQGMEIARWALKNCQKFENGLSVISRLQSISFHAGAGLASYPERGTKEEKQKFAEQNLQKYIDLRSSLIEQAMNLDLAKLINYKKTEIQKLKPHAHGRQLIDYFSQNSGICTADDQNRSVERLYRGAGLTGNLRRDSSRLALEGLSWSGFMMADSVLKQPAPKDYLNLETCSHHRT